MPCMNRFHSACLLAFCIAFMVCCSTHQDDTQPADTTPAATDKKGYAIAIGLNRIDANHYGTDGALSGCEPDANDMAKIASENGLQTTKLLTKQATRERVLSVLADHANKLKAGDLLVVSYSGHGGQVPDKNGDEDDGLDETWCLYDGQLLDDELRVAWSKFKAGVRILVFSDSCHSGTVLKMTGVDIEGPGTDRIRHLDTKWGALRELPKLNKGVILNNNAMKTVLSRDAALRRKIDSHPSFQRDSDGRLKHVPTDKRTRGPLPEDPIFRPRSLAPGQAALAYSKNKADYDKIGTEVPKEGTVKVRASVLSISGCEDNQLSADIGYNGLFTWELKRVWANGGFHGDHPDFHTAIRDRVKTQNSSQSPRFDRVGKRSPPFEAQTPYTIQ